MSLVQINKLKSLVSRVKKVTGEDFPTQHADIDRLLEFLSDSMESLNKMGEIKLINEILAAVIDDTERRPEKYASEYRVAKVEKENPNTIENDEHITDQPGKTVGYELRIDSVSYTIRPPYDLHDLQLIVTWLTKQGNAEAARDFTGLQDKYLKNQSKIQQLLEKHLLN